MIATIGIIFAALYVLWVFQRTMTGPLRGEAVLGGGPGAASAAALSEPADGGLRDMLEDDASARGRARFGDLTGREIGVLAPLVLLIFLLGFFPQPVLNIVNPAVSATMSEVGVADPVVPERSSPDDHDAPRSRAAAPCPPPLGVDYGALAPLFVILGAACVSVLVEAFVPLARRAGGAARALPRGDRRRARPGDRAGRERHPGHDRARRVAVGRRREPLPLGHAAGPRDPLGADDRRPLGRGRRRVRRRPRGARRGPGAGPVPGRR